MEYKQKEQLPRKRAVLICDLAYFACAIATATATVAPTIGLLPMPMRPIISTCAGTDDLGIKFRLLTRLLS